MTSDLEDMRRLVRRWERALRVESDRGPRDTLLAPPADESDVRAAEERLGFTLPPSYRLFLKVSNGAFASWRGIAPNSGVYGFLPVQRVAMASAAVPDLVDHWTANPDLRNAARRGRQTESAPAAVTEYSALGNAVLISQPFDAFCDVLVPRTGEEEWELWAFAKEGAIAFSSFGAVLRWQVAQIHKRSSISNDELVAAILGGEVGRLAVLQRRGDFRAYELALAMLEPGSAIRQTLACKIGAGAAEWTACVPAAQVLAEIGDPRSFAALRAAWDRARSHQARINLLAALERVGGNNALPLLRRAADEDRDPQVREWASHRLRSRREDSIDP